MFSFLKRFFLGDQKNPLSEGVFEKITLVAFLAWVGLGADGLSSSSYGPEEATRALHAGGHPELVWVLGLLMAITIVVIAASYCQVVRLFPSGGGGYVVATRFLGSKVGLMSGMALLIDYVLTVAISCAAACHVFLSRLAPEWHQYVVPLTCVCILIMIIINMRGVKESVIYLMPIFLIFLITHALGIVVVWWEHGGDLPQRFQSDMSQALNIWSQDGLLELLVPLMAAYAIGAGTFTGIEAVSNSMQILREPKVETARRTMVYMAGSLCFMAVGLLIGYALLDVNPERAGHATFSVFFFTEVSKDWTLFGMDIGPTFAWLSAGSEACILFVAAQAGFVGGPRMLATLALDGWLPKWFGRLSDRLVINDGVWVMGLGGMLFVIATGAEVRVLVIFYALNVFITFFCTHLGLVVHWIKARHFGSWKRDFCVAATGLLLTSIILVAICTVNFNEGAWMTLLLTGSLIVIGFLIRRHYRRQGKMVMRLDHQLNSVLTPGNKEAPDEPDQDASTAVLMVTGYNGLGAHALLAIFRLFPNQFKNFVFLSVGVIDYESFKGTEELKQLEGRVSGDLEKYVSFMRGQGYYATSYHRMGLDATQELEILCQKVNQEFSHPIFFGGQLTFNTTSWATRLLHHNNAVHLQRQLHLQGMNMVILPIRVDG